MFNVWIKHMPQGQLERLTPLAFSKDSGIRLEDAKLFFSHLAKGELATLFIGMRCSECNEHFTTNAVEGSVDCPACGASIQEIETKNINNVYYQVEKTDFIATSQPINEVSLIHDLVLRKKEHSHEGEQDKMIDIAIIAALDEELAPILSAMDNRKEDEYGTYRFTLGTYSHNGETINIVAGKAHRMGMLATAMLTNEVCRRYKPRYLAMTGIAAATDKAKYCYGDILVPEIIWDYGVGKISETSDGYYILHGEPYQIPLQNNMKSKIDQFKRNYAFFAEIKHKLEVSGLVPNSELKLHIGPMASGSAVISNKNYVADIVGQQRKLIGFDMELYGMFYAAEHNTDHNPICFAMKSVVDYGDTEKSDSYHKYACNTSAASILHFACTYLDQ